MPDRSSEQRSKPIPISSWWPPSRSLWRAFATVPAPGQSAMGSSIRSRLGETRAPRRRSHPGRGVIEAALLLYIDRQQQIEAAPSVIRAAPGHNLPPRTRAAAARPHLRYLWHVGPRDPRGTNGRVRRLATPRVAPAGECVGASAAMGRRTFLGLMWLLQVTGAAHLRSALSQRSSMTCLEAKLPETRGLRGASTVSPSQ